MEIFTALAAATTLYVGKKVYDKRQKKKNTLVQVLMPPPTPSIHFKPLRHKLNILLEPFIGDSRHQHLQEITATEKSDFEKLVDRNLIISGVMLGVAVVGSLVYWPITLLTLPGVVVVAAPIYQAAYHALIKEHRVRIEVVDAIVITIVFATGHFVINIVGALFYFASKKLLLKTEDHSIRKLVNIFGQQPRFVWILVDGVEVQIPFEQLQLGDTIIINAGQVIPVDGCIIQGQASIDQHMLTGEAQPAEKQVGDSCFASTIVLAGHIYLKVEKSGHETVAAQIGQILNNTIDFKEVMLSQGQEMADKSALPMLLFSTLTVPFVGLIGGATVLNSSFGYTMRMVSPVMMLNFLTIASQEGILIKDGRSLERLSKVDTVIFDKTGTLTLTQPLVGKIHTLYDFSENQLLTYAATAEYKQSHPIALAILHEAKIRQLNLLSGDEAKYEIGYGIKVTLQNEIIHVGSARFMESAGIEIPTIVQTLAEYTHQEGYSLVYVAVNNQLGGAIELHPTIRPEAKRIAMALRARDISLFIISGDHEQPTRHLAQQLGIDNYFAQVLPENKADIITSLQQQKRTVCFVGDGINDSIALKRADVSVSLRGASTIATDTAQIILMDGSLNQLELLFDLGQQFNHHLKLNVITSIVPGIITISGVFLFGFGISFSIISNQIGLISGMGNSMRPLLTYQQKHS